MQGSQRPASAAPAGSPDKKAKTPRRRELPRLQDSLKKPLHQIWKPYEDEASETFPMKEVLPVPADSSEAHRPPAPAGGALADKRRVRRPSLGLAESRGCRF